METSFVYRGRLIFGSHILEDGVLIAEEGIITKIVDAHDPSLSREDRELIIAVPTSDSYILSGLVDVHYHGGGGSSFPNATSTGKAQAAIDEHRHHGMMTLVASLVTTHADVLRERAALLTELAEEGELAGIHFEGPFVSHARCGTQDPEYIINPDPELAAELLEICKGYALTMTLAPEKDRVYGPGSVTGVLIEGGTLPSWGHTGSGSAPTREALEFSHKAIKETTNLRSARTTITHLFNDIRPLHHRDTGPIGGFLSGAAREGVIAEMICDGVYLNPSLVRDVYEVLGRDPYVFVTDAMEAAGVPNGIYELGSQTVDVRDGYTYIAGTITLIGGTTHLLDCVHIATFKGRIDLVNAVLMATVQGARILGRYDIGKLGAGMCTDVLELDEQLRPQRVWRDGTLVK